MKKNPNNFWEEHNIISSTQDFEDALIDFMRIDEINTFLTNKAKEHLLDKSIKYFLPDIDIDKVSSSFSQATDSAKYNFLNMLPSLGGAPLDTKIELQLNVLNSLNLNKYTQITAKKAAAVIFSKTIGLFSTNPHRGRGLIEKNTLFLSDKKTSRIALWTEILSKYRSSDFLINITKNADFFAKNIADGDQKFILISVIKKMKNQINNQGYISNEDEKTFLHFHQNHSDLLKPSDYKKMMKEYFVLDYWMALSLEHKKQLAKTWVREGRSSMLDEVIDNGEEEMVVKAFADFFSSKIATQKCRAVWQKHLLKEGIDTEQDPPRAGIKRKM